MSTVTILDNCVEYIRWYLTILKIEVEKYLSYKQIAVAQALFIQNNLVIPDLYESSTVMALFLQNR